MDKVRRYNLTNVVLFAATGAHALWTWPLAEAVALFVGGAALAFVLETLAVRAGLLRHNLTPRMAGVPATVLLAWPAVVYVWYRVALLVAPVGIAAAALAAVFATLVDAFVDPNGVRDGAWEYPETPVSSPRFRGVPWWNFVAWLVVVFVTAMAPAFLS